MNPGTSNIERRTSNESKTHNFPSCSNPKQLESLGEREPAFAQKLWPGRQQADAKLSRNRLATVTDRRYIQEQLRRDPARTAQRAVPAWFRGCFKFSLFVIFRRAVIR